MNLEEIRIIPWTGQIPFSEISEMIRRAHANRKEITYNTTNITEDDVQKRIRNGGVVYVAAEGQKVVGTMTICRQNSTGYYVTGNAAGIHYVAVDPEYAGHGIATRLLHECIQWAEDNNIQTILWNTAENNTAALSFCEKNGFKKVECLKYKSIEHFTVRLAYWMDKQPVSDMMRVMRYNISRQKLSIKKALR